MKKIFTKEHSVPLAFALALFLQGAHMVEHLAQFYQHAILWKPIKESHGILFFADLEWNHFTFNLLYFLLLSYVFVYASKGDTKKKRIGWNLFLLGFAIQGYHVLEHSFRIGQHLLAGCEPCPGFLGWHVDGIYLHFAFNTVTLLLPAVLFFTDGFWNRTKKILKSES